MYATGTAGSKLQATVLVQNQTLVDADLVVDRLDMEAGTGDSTAFEYVPLGDAA